MPGYEKEGGGQDLEGLLAKRELAEKERKEAQGKIDGIANKVKSIEGMICDPKTGQCWLPTHEDLTKANESLREEIKKQKKEILEAVQSKIADGLKPKKLRGVLGSPHQTKEELRECPECQTELVQDYLGPLGLKKAAEKISEHPEICKDLSPDQCKCLLTGVCDILTPEQRKELEASGLRISKKEEKKEESRGSFLLEK